MYSSHLVTEITADYRSIRAIRQQNLERHLEFIDLLVAEGGPKESDYGRLDTCLTELGALAEVGELSREDITELQARFGDALSLATLHGYSFLKPNGYAGDYEIIDKLHCGHIATEKHLANWDHYFQKLPASIAVRNRKTYFHDLLDRHVARHSGILKVLNVASGPCRDIYEYLNARNNARVHFHCVEQDRSAISYASTLCSSFAKNITFTQNNALWFRPEPGYDLVWSAGLFDYLDDRLFVAILKRLCSGLLPDGELVVGNFSTRNPTRHYMKYFLEWSLYHRGAGHLIELAERCAIRREQISVAAEPEHINLFLHVKT